MATGNYVQSTFDRAFNRVVEYLLKEKKVTQVALADELQILYQNLNNALKGKRGLPSHKKDFAIYILTDKYNVRKEFLETNNGPYFTDSLPVDPAEHPEYDALKRENELLIFKNQELESRIKALQKTIETQDGLISALKVQINKDGR